MSGYRARYLELSKEVFKNKIEQANSYLRNCCLCPRECNINRVIGETGFCGAGADVEIAHWQIHYGEEPPLSGKNGAGAVFFAHCNLKCVYCQNYQISQQSGIKKSISVDDLSSVMLDLQKQGAQNIDFVSPTQFAAQIIEAVYIARNKGLSLPLVYNTNGYERVEILNLLDGIIDVYLPDFKYYDDSAAVRYSEAVDYTAVAQRAISTMYAQTGDLVVDSGGSALRGILLRHLVLPEGIAGSISVLKFLADQLGTDIGLSLMSQYHPCYRADRFSELNRTITSKEYDEVVDYVQELGFEKCWIQELESHKVYLPDFEKEDVF
ncbi:MAG: radical SAM protein [PVC group bacterium]|nr:radical SAM protein [PVC group bacterium]